MSAMDLILVGIVLLILVAVVVWRFSAVHLSGASRSFYQSLREWEQTLGVNDRYETPWLLMVGDDDLATPLLQGWGLESTARPAWFGRWWYGPEGAVLVVPSSLFNHGENASVQLKLWRQLLGLLVQSRARRPLDAVIWLCAMDQLNDSQITAAAGAAARHKFIDLQQRLGLSLPVYMVIGGSEAVPGLVDMVNVLPVTSQDLPLGWTSPHDAHTSWHPNWITQATGQMQRLFGDLILELGTLRGQIGADLYQLPQRLQALHDPLQALCDPVFQGNAMGEAPRLRGVYFCVAARAAARAGQSVDIDPFAELSDLPAEPPLFSRRLWRQRFVAEQGLAQPISRILHLRQRWQRLLGVGALVVSVVWIIGMFWIWNVRSAEADRLAELLNDEQSLMIQGQDDEQARQRITGFWHLLGATPRWHLGTAVLPGSRFYGLDQKLDHELLLRSRDHLLGPIRQRLQDDLNQLAAGDGDTQDNPDNIDIAWQQAQHIVDEAQNLERRSHLFNLSIETSEQPLEDAAQLANELFGMSLQPRNLVHHAHYERLLSEAEQPLSTPMDLIPARAQVTQRYLQAMRLWLDTLFASTDFGSIAQVLNNHLGKLQAGQRNSLGELEEVNASIEHLRHLVTQTNAAWSQNSAIEHTSGYKDSMQRARQSSLIGPAVVEQIEQYAKTTKRSFFDHWLERGDQRSLLRQHSGGTLELQGNLEKLDQGIQNLLREEFAQASMNQSRTQLQSGEGLRNIDAGSLSTALHYYGNYQNFLNQQVAELPPIYRKGLIASARSAVNSAIWQSLGDRSDNAVQWNASGVTRDFDLPVDKALQVLQAVADVGDNRQVELLRYELNNRALNDLRRASLEMQSLPVLRSPIDFTNWDGTRNLALRSFREADIPSLKQSLSRQYTLISDSLDKVRPAIDWLTTQREFLASNDLSLVGTFTNAADAMKKYAEQNPTSSPLLYQQLVTREFNDMDMGNCAKTLAGAVLPEGNSYLAVLARTSWEQARQRCSTLQNYTAAVAWQQLSVYFNTYLAGRFPFSNRQGAVDANPDRVREFLELIDKYLPDAYSGLQNNLSRNSGAAADFLFNLQQARAWLGPMLIRDKEGLRGLDLEVRWRTDREEERGADQIIEWNLETGPRQVGYPAENLSHANWTVGEPVRLTLRWAQGSDQRPLDDASQSALAVAGLNASWSYEGPWALLRFIRTHQAINHFTSRDNADRPLALQLPLRTQTRNGGALMFLRVSLKALGGKQPLVMSELPVRVPPAPYPTIDPLPEPITAEFKP